MIPLPHVDNGEPWVISYWHIPNGSDYEHAEARVVFVETEEVATKIAQRFATPPEMAFIMSRADYDKVRAQTRR